MARGDVKEPKPGVVANAIDAPEAEGYNQAQRINKTIENVKVGFALNNTEGAINAIKQHAQEHPVDKIALVAVGNADKLIYIRIIQKEFQLSTEDIITALEQQKAGYEAMGSEDLVKSIDGFLKELRIQLEKENQAKSVTEATVVTAEEEAPEAGNLDNEFEIKPGRKFPKWLTRIVGAAAIIAMPFTSGLEAYKKWQAEKDLVPPPPTTEKPTQEPAEPVQAESEPEPAIEKKTDFEARRDEVVQGLNLIRVESEGNQNVYKKDPAMDAEGRYKGSLYYFAPQDGTWRYNNRTQPTTDDMYLNVDADIHNGWSGTFNEPEQPEPAQVEPVVEEPKLSPEIAQRRDQVIKALKLTPIDGKKNEYKRDQEEFKGARYTFNPEDGTFRYDNKTEDNQQDDLLLPDNSDPEYGWVSESVHNIMQQYNIYPASELPGFLARDVKGLDGYYLPLDDKLMYRDQAKNVSLILDANYKDFEADWKQATASQISRFDGALKWARKQKK